MEQRGGKAVYKPYRLCCIYQLYSMPACGIMTYMHFLSAGPSRGFAGGHLRFCPEISPSLSRDISVLARRYLRPRPQISLPAGFHAPINPANGILFP